MIAKKLKPFFTALWLVIASPRQSGSTSTPKTQRPFYAASTQDEEPSIGDHTTTADWQMFMREKYGIAKTESIE